MKKGQSFIIEFILFFAISFSLFSVISYYFYSQNEFYKEKVGKFTTELVNDLLIIDVIKGVNCKSCDEITISEEIPSQIGGFYCTVRLKNQGFNTTVYLAKPFSQETPIFNLNSTYTVIPGSDIVSENKIVGIKINNVGETLEVK
jgi:hypothetical protein